jgi:23S rRNA pseudouridine1911/1915/1917 synthase
VITDYKFDYEETNLERLDKYLTTRLDGFSRSRIQKLIDDGHVQVDGQVAFKTGIMLEAGMQIHVIIPEPEPTKLVAEDIQLDVIFENDDVLVIDKPAGLVVHPSAGHSNGTLVNAALAIAPEMEGIAGEGRPGVVHRLDKDTSGVILFAKNDAALNRMQAQFKDREIEKTYIALVDRRPPTPEGRIEAPIGRDPVRRQRMAVVPLEKGREAITIYHTVENFTNHTLLDVQILTGRTHQIRVHMAYIGSPVAGDTTYGYRRSSIPCERQFLHAAKLRVILPGSSEPMEFNSPLPKELKQVLDHLRSGR